MPNFSQAEPQKNGLLPAGIIACFELTMDKPKPEEAHTDPMWEGYAKRGNPTQTDFTIYSSIKCNLEIIEGSYKGKRVYKRVYTHKEKLNEPENPLMQEETKKMTKNAGTFFRAIIDSSENLQPDNDSPEAEQKRNIGMNQLQYKRFLGVIGIKKGRDGIQENILKAIITPDDPRYEQSQHALAEAGIIGHGNLGQENLEQELNDAIPSF